MRLRILTVAGMVTVALAGCTTGTGTGHPSASASPDGRAAALGVATCMRANGFPNYPDPIQDSRGNWTFPATNGNATAPPACDAMVRAWKMSTLAGQGPTAAEMAQRRAYAKCLRSHGIADFPDPDSDGNFPLTEAQRARAESQAAAGARQSCASLAPPRAPDKPAPGPSAT